MARSFKTSAQALAAVAVLLVGLEGITHVSTIPVPGDVPTVCVGHTQTVDQKKIYTKQECYDLLDKDVLVAAKAVDRLVKVPLNDNERVAYISFVFNVGQTAFSKSTLLKLLNAGQYENACTQMYRWVYVKGRYVKGLKNRRDAEVAKCLEPVPEPPKEKPGFFASLKAKVMS